MNSTLDDHIKSVGNVIKIREERAYKKGRAKGKTEGVAMTLVCAFIFGIIIFYAGLYLGTISK